MSYPAFPTEKEILDRFDCNIVADEEEDTQFSCIFLKENEKLEITIDWVRRDVSARIFRNDSLVADFFVDRVQSMTLHAEEREFLVAADNFRGRIHAPPNAFFRVARLFGIEEMPKPPQTSAT